MPRTRLTFNNARRLEEIIMVLLRFGFSDWVSRLHLRRLGGKLLFWRQKPSGDAAVNRGNRLTSDAALRWRRFRLALEELGPTFIKFGQIMANRSDFLPLALISELEKLQDQVPPFAADQVIPLIERELGRPVAEMFPEFNPIAVASASIAQVHEARLQNGQHLAIKVQRPDIEPLIQRDLEVLALLAGLVVRYVPDLRHFNPPGLVDEFRRQILRELDFSLELHNMNRFASMLQDQASLHVPTTYPEFSSSRVLCMEFIEGTKLSLVFADHDQRFDKPLLARRFADLMLEQVFNHGFFHADPHPGNILVLPDNVLCFLDFGMMGRIRPDEQDILVEMLTSMVEHDYRHVTTSLLRLFGHSQHEAHHLENEIADLLDQNLEQALGTIDFGEVFQRLVGIIQQHSLTVPSKYLLMAKAMVIAEGVGMKLSPEFSFMSVFGPFARRMAFKRLRPERLVRAGLERAGDYAALVQEFPGEALEIMQAVRRGDLYINFRLRGIEPLQATIESIGTRLVFGLVLAAILISSSLIIRAGVAPYIYGMSIIGLIGFGIAGIMSLGFLLVIVRHLFKKSSRGD